MKNLTNGECFSNRRNIQMKTILQWREMIRAAEKAGGGVKKAPPANDNFLTVDFVSIHNDVNGTPSQNSYLRILDWLSSIPLDEDELSYLRR